MKEIVQNVYGSPDVLEIKEVERPKLKENEVLVRVSAASINAGDIFSLKGSPWLAAEWNRLRRSQRNMPIPGCGWLDSGK